MGDKNWFPLQEAIARHEVSTLTVCYNDREFHDDPLLKAGAGGSAPKQDIVTWPHSIGGVPKALKEAGTASVK